MYKFLTVLFFFLSAVSAIAGGLTAQMGQGWEIMAGWLVWSAVFYRAACFFYKLTPKHKRIY